MRSDFEKFDLSLKKDLIFVIMVSHKAKIVKAANIFTVDLPGFTNIVRTGFSYLTVVQRFYYSRK